MDNLGLCMTRTTLGRELRTLDTMNNFVDMNDSESWDQGSKCYEQLRIVDDMSYSWLWA